MAKEFPYGVIVLDVMPRVRRVRVVSTVREAEIWTPVLMLTARDEIGDRGVGWMWEPTTTWSSPSAFLSSQHVSGPCHVVTITLDRPSYRLGT